MALSPLGRLATVALAGLAFTACASMDVRSFVERGVDFTQFRTYDWAATEARATGDPRLDNNPFFHERVRADVERELAKRGFEKTTSGTPDVQLHYYASVTQELNLNGMDQPYTLNATDRAYTRCNNCEPFVYDAGTLMVDLVDTRTNRLAWRGWAEGSIDGMVDNQEWMEERIAESVARIMERLPRRF
ncbi:MAG: DUF4136 domain-containing protein [Acidobacteria bacterium]|nr:DUF4136 domain-containing protein [Acidobacteriota bacterium]